MYRALYRKYRPKDFDEVIGQRHITDVLKKQCADGKLSHAYLFCGTRGTGKTSSAKILAKAANCLSPVNGNPCFKCKNCLSFESENVFDFFEIDAASNNSVDNIRDLRDEVLYPPTVLNKKVYIIDEVHMLSAGAFNALLKTLEEPPEYVIFILATTELNKIPATVLSRCQRFEFRRINAECISERLDSIAEKENIALDKDASLLIARLAEGGMRDALSLLESCIAGAENTHVTLKLIEERIGISGNSSVIDMIEAIHKNDIKRAIDISEQVKKSAKNLSTLIEDLSYLTRDILFAKSTKEKNIISDRFFFTEEDKNRIFSLSEEMSFDELYYCMTVLEEVQSRISRYSLNKQLLFELGIIKLCRPDSSYGEDALNARIARLEAAVDALSAINRTVPAVKKTKKEEKNTDTTNQISLFTEEQ